MFGVKRELFVPMTGVDAVRLRGLYDYKVLPVKVFVTERVI